MKKQLFMGLGIVVLTLGIGTAAFANANHNTSLNTKPSTNQEQPTGQNYKSDNTYNWESVIMGTQIGIIR
ncbi:hypothetical protein ACK8P5_13105 [Paenibacillus sp. EC2-1]|uniref:hypothetical protein n=1 Tax=Paenibacillus sp. EC2-1 TaxID=3388665 RepID=UPI003BEF18DE